MSSGFQSFSQLSSGKLQSRLNIAAMFLDHDVDMRCCSYKLPLGFFFFLSFLLFYQARAPKFPQMAIRVNRAWIMGKRGSTTRTNT